MVEILVAVLILGFISLIILGASQASIRGRKVAYQQQERFHTARVAVSMMVRDLESAYLSKHRNLEKNPKTLFKGSGDKLTFTYLGHLRVVEGSKESDQGVVSYYVENDRDIPGTKCLMRREKTPPDDRPEKGGTAYKLAERVKSLELSYYDPSENAQDWKDEWEAELNDLDPVIAEGGEVAEALRKAKDAADQLTGEDEEFALPSRVRIRLVLSDESGKDYAFESQARCYIRKPLKW